MPAKRGNLQKLVPNKPIKMDTPSPIPVCEECKQQHVYKRGKKVMQACAGHNELGNIKEPCGNKPATNNTRCVEHEGKHLRTLRNHQIQYDWKADMYLEKLPPRLKGIFAKLTQTDAEVSMNKQLALLDARELELIGRLDTDESGAAWRRVKGSAKELKAAIEREDKVAQAKQLWLLLDAIEKGGSEEEQWDEIRFSAEGRRKISETERKHLDAQRASMSLDQIGQVASFLGNLLKRYITDQARLAAAAEELSRYFKGTAVVKALPDPSIIEGEVVPDAG